MYGGGSEAAAAGLHLSMGSLIEEQQRAAPQMVSNTSSVPRLFICSVTVTPTRVPLYVRLGCSEEPFNSGVR